MNPLLDWVHHDGSELYLDDEQPALGDVVTIRLRIPAGLQPEDVIVRAVHDGEPYVIRAEQAEVGEAETWWDARLPVRNVRTHYRWLLSGGNVGYAWITAAGVMHHDITDAFDFAVSASPAPPAWASSSVVYQVFPDRFARSDRSAPAPQWAVARAWDRHPEGRSKNTPIEYYGGDLWGAAARLDHLEELGADVLYMTPIFPARSTHRYDASTFDDVDPLLGGTPALEHLVAAAHARGIRVVGDITLNHCGREHEWFQSALTGGPTREFFTFDDALENGYESWLGVPSLPKFNYRSNELRRRLIAGEESVIARWLRGDHGFDGWRVDVANMSGRQGADDMTHEIARLTRAQVQACGADKLLIAEHFHDAGEDLDGDGWHGAMNYSAFMKPVWSWLIDDSAKLQWLGLPVPVPQTDGRQMVDTIRSFAARMPWRSYAASWSLLGSHDTARIRTVVGSRERHIVALGLLMTLPGTPMIFAGDEIGAEGSWGEDSRTTFPWDRPGEWDMPTFHAYSAFAHLRRTSHALARGGLRFVHVDADAVVFLRESSRERLLVAASRAAGPSAHLPLARLGARSIERVVGHEVSLAGDGLTIPFDGPGVQVWRLV